MTALGVGLPGHREGTLANLLSPEVRRIRAAAERQGGAESWGFRDLLPGRLCAEPDILLQRLLLEMIQLLNGIMEQLPLKPFPVYPSVLQTYCLPSGTGNSANVNGTASAGNSDCDAHDRSTA